VLKGAEGEDWGWQWTLGWTAKVSGKTEIKKRKEEGNSERGINEAIREKATKIS